MSRQEPIVSHNAGSRKLALGAIASGAVNFLKIGIQLLLLPIMARLLGPAEFGIYALALPTISVVTLLADGGLGATLAREPETSSIVWSSAFWFLLLTGIVLALATSGFGFLLSYIVEQPRVFPMIAVLSFSLIFLVLSVPPWARITRRKDLGTGAAAELAGNVIGAGIAVILAANGAGAWSLVAQYLTIYGVRALVLNIAAFDLPKFEFSMNAIRSHMVSGGLLVGTRLCDYVGRVGENILINRVFGTSLLGSYTFANQVTRFTGEAVGNVTWATLYIQAISSDRQSTAKLHQQLCRLLGAVLFPTTFLAAAAAPELIDALLGPAWSGLTPLLRILLPFSVLSVMATQIGAILLAINKFELQFFCVLGITLGRLLVVCAGYRLGLTGVAYGLAAINLVHFVAVLGFSGSVTGSSSWRLLQGLVGPAVSSLVAAGICLLLLGSFPAGISTTIASLAASLVAFGACMLVIDRKGLTEDWQALRTLMMNRRTAEIPS